MSPGTANTSVLVGNVGTVDGCGNGLTIGVSAPDVLWCAGDSPDDGQTLADMSITAPPTAAVPPAPQARSTAVLNLPQGATVTDAWIFFAASVDANNANDVINNASTTATLDRPGDNGFSVQLIPDPDPDTQSTVTTRTTAYGDNPRNTFAYQTRANVTDIVKQYGSGAYRVGGFNVRDFPHNPNDDAFVGWWMVVFYELKSDPQRNLALYDAFDAVNSNTTTNGQPGLQSTLKGFVVPADANFQAKLGVVAWEGDAYITGDNLYFGNDLQNPVTNALNPVDDFFNSTRSQSAPAGANPDAVGVSNDGDLPQLTGTQGSMSGMDIDVVDVTSRLSVGDQQASLVVKTGADSFVLGGYVLSVSELMPDFNGSTKVAANNTQHADNAVLPGDTLKYTIVLTNVGDDAATHVNLTDSLPPQVTCVDGSVNVMLGGNDITDTVNATCNGDALSLDLPNFDARGGANTSATVTFQVTVNEGATGTISNQATIACDDANGNNPQTFTTTGDENKAGATTDTPIDQCTTGDEAPCTDPQKPICNTTKHPFECVQCVGDTDCASGQLCDENTNTCQAGQPCSTDSDCGSATSGHVCDDTSKICKLGCRGQNGNGCPSGETCSSTNSDIGTCQAGQPCNQDSDCGGINNGQVCNDTSKVCQPGCRGVDGSGCVSGQTCSSTNAEIGTCSGTGQNNSFVFAGGGCSAGPAGSSDNSSSTLLLAGTVAAVVAASRRRSQRSKSMRV
ncbi:MAG: isopeptide-forming domain-containing fimbrial protein [Polyangiaceae bacterium]|nr:isopeptide-forming domain-containing fimbrial protein [Polyangiaceae bacterium]